MPLLTRFVLATMLRKPFTHRLPKSTLQMKFHSTSKEEAIKPSLPTPNHLRTFKLSYLDQFMQPIYVPFVFFYPNQIGTHISGEDKIACLKDSLSKALTRFYPLAGRIKDLTTVDCNDEGAIFKEAKVSGDMFDCLTAPKLELLNTFLPFPPVCSGPLEMAVHVGVQANVFSCGGIAIGICVFHKIMDATTFDAFLTSWSSIASGSRESTEIVNAHDLNVAASIFPTKQLSSTSINYVPPSTTEILSHPNESKLIVRRFLFNAASISTFKDKARSEQVPNPTRAEVVSGLIWKCAMNASKPSIFRYAVNIRPRLKPSLPDYSVGNIFWPAIANYQPITQRSGDLLPHLVSLLRKSVDGINSKNLQKFQGDEGFEEICRMREKEREMLSSCSSKPVTYMVSNVSRMGFYEADFGWGKPIWIACATTNESAEKNFILQLGNRSGDGIEVWMSLEEHDIEKLEHDPEFVAHVHSNPNVFGFENSEIHM